MSPKHRIEICEIIAVPTMTIDSMRQAAIETGVDVKGIWVCVNEPGRHFRRGKNGKIYTFKKIKNKLK